MLFEAILIGIASQALSSKSKHNSQSSNEAQKRAEQYQKEIERKKREALKEWQKAMSFAVYDDMKRKK